MAVCNPDWILWSRWWPNFNPFSDNSGVDSLLQTLSPPLISCLFQSKNALLRTSSRPQLHLVTTYYVWSCAWPRLIIIVSTSSSSQQQHLNGCCNDDNRTLAFGLPPTYSWHVYGTLASSLRCVMRWCVWCHHVVTACNSVLSSCSSCNASWLPDDVIATCLLTVTSSKRQSWHLNSEAAGFVSPAS
jgi:hypothetical protein